MRLVIIDFEATCWKYKPKNPTQEIIEIGYVIAELPSLERLEAGSIIVRPVFNPKLSKFCTKLTSITQDMVKKGIKFSKALAMFAETLKPGDIFGSWGAFDKKILHNNCQVFGDVYPFQTNHINVKTLVGKLMSDTALHWTRRGGGLMSAVQKLNIDFEGKWHRGGDDAINILNVIVACQDYLDHSGRELSFADEIIELSE